jgi:hypothetical protein
MQEIYYSRMLSIQKLEYISQEYYKIRPNYVMFYVGESVTLRSIPQDIRDNDISFYGGNDTLRVLLLDTGFNFGKFDSR